jgi:hypothetical protein
MIRIVLAAAALAGVILFAPPAVAQAPYKNCSEAKANGDCNIPQDSPYYQAKLDRDGDGIGCEC